jgi:hypothetical protein
MLNFWLEPEEIIDDPGEHVFDCRELKTFKKKTHILVH